jgi:DNA helicase HerA-like ATPase
LSRTPEPPTGDEVSASTQRVLGTVTGPGEDPNEFNFIAPESDSIKTGEFVTYEAEVGGNREEIIARVTNRTQERGLPNSFMSDPNVSPDNVADTLGVPTEDIDLYLMTATVVGYFDDTMDSFVNPRLLPEPGTHVKLASDSFLERVLPDADWDSETGKAYVGWLLNRDQRSANVFLPIDSFASTHLAILASTGSGKSYTASVLIEEMMRPQSRAAMLIFDPHGEYTTLTEMMEDENADVFQSDDGYTPDVEILTQEDIDVRISDLTFGDLLSVLDDPSNKMEATLRQAWDSLQDQDSEHVTIQDIVRRCADIEGDDSSTVDALRWRLYDALSRDLFDASSYLELSDILRPGQVTVLDLSRIPKEDQQMLAAVLLRKIYQQRERAQQGEEVDIDYPVFSLMEEGHRFAPEGNARSLGIMRTILSEGRKFGFGIGIISQRPSKVDDDVLSQCGTQVIMQLKNPNDQQAIRQSVESAGESVLSELPGLTPGQAVISGDAMNTPVLVKVRERYTKHGASSPDATLDWKEAWKEKENEPSGVRSPASEDEEDLETGPL